MLQSVRMAGLPAEMGRQHGEQIWPLRPLLVEVLEARLAELRELGADAPAAYDPARAALEEHDRPLLEFVGGLAETLALPYEKMLIYTLSSYLRDLHTVTHPMAPIAKELQRTAPAEDGCSTWAAAGRVTLDGAPILAKNRDYHADHIPLQLAASVSPAEGYDYFCLGSAGSPHVFSSGINEAGLAVADTHVLSRDIGPGLPRFSLMRELLEGHGSTASALSYLRSVPHMGAGTLILADAKGHLAVCESGNSRCGYVEALPEAAETAPYVASTNHFVTAGMERAWVEDEAPLLVGNSPGRRARILEALAGARASIDSSFAKSLMSAHGTLTDALCRHPFQPEDAQVPGRYDGSTISSVVYLPRGVTGDGSSPPAVWVAAGTPCAGAWELWEVGA